MKSLHAVIASLVFLSAAFVPAFAAEAASYTKPEKPARIAHGEEVNIADHAVPGKTTVFDFTSDYCPPCRRIAPLLDQLHASRDDIVVVKVDINRPDKKGIDWSSPVAKQYNIKSVPNFKIYGPDGKLQAEGQEAREIVIGMLEG
jgi:Thiol:disulfide interchange protein